MQGVRVYLPVRLLPSKNGCPKSTYFRRENGEETYDRHTEDEAVRESRGQKGSVSVGFVVRSIGPELQRDHKLDSYVLQGLANADNNSFGFTTCDRAGYTSCAFKHDIYFGVNIFASRMAMQYARECLRTKACRRGLAPLPDHFKQLCRFSPMVHWPGLVGVSIVKACHSSPAPKMNLQPCLSLFRLSAFLPKNERHYRGSNTGPHDGYVKTAQILLQSYAPPLSYSVLKETVYQYCIVNPAVFIPWRDARH
jgi:hypothetical protein